MTVKEAKQALTGCIEPVAVSKVTFNNQQYDEFFFILSVSDSLFLGVNERDFQLDGFTVRRLCDISSVTAVRGTYLKIHQSEGSLRKISVPPIDIKNWQNVLRSVVASNELVIVEGIVPDTQNKFFLIGRALATGEQGFRFRSFDGGGNWSDKTLNIPYDSVTALTFGSSYVTTYAKYVKPYPEIIEQRPTPNR